MKKILVVCCLMFSLIYFPTSVIVAGPFKDAKQGLPYTYTPPEGSVEELYKDILVTLIEPYITNEVEKNYGQLLQYDLFNIEFLKIERPSYRSFSFLIKIQIKPFVGAHNSIGIDNITIRVSPIETKVEEFEHIKSFSIPPHLKNSYKNLKL
ncbi:DUF3888 domain-containing protein [Clostridium sp.]|jgi:hypothetical protein|uniref:DUF3888 domain-containing protein n=1 Tax=Clostridium sp. TaxID=1506 RepID=UPI003EE92C4D